ALTKMLHPNDRVIVRAKLYDPRVFYIAHVHGWLVNRFSTDTAPDAQQFAARIQHGARYYVDPIPAPEPTPVEKWLEAHHARLLQPACGGRIWDLAPAD